MGRRILHNSSSITCYCDNMLHSRTLQNKRHNLQRSFCDTNSDVDGVISIVQYFPLFFISRLLDEYCRPGRNKNQSLQRHIVDISGLVLLAILFGALDFRNEILDNILQAWVGKKPQLGQRGILLYPYFKHCDPCFRSCCRRYGS